jgi:uncharacterized Tic20 family protein
METETTPSPTSDERTIAGISHLFGPIVALVFYALKKDRSPYVRFQTVQALAFDLIIMLVSMVVFGCLGVLVAAGVAGGTLYLFDHARSIDPEMIAILPAFFPFVLMLLVLPFSIITFCIRLWAAIAVFQGKNFHYPWLGQRVESFLAS